MRVWVAAWACLGLVSAADLHYSQEELEKEARKQTVFYDSLVRLQSVSTRHFLCGNELQFSSDAGLLVTAEPKNDQHSSLWMLGSAAESPAHNYDRALRCDDVVTLTAMGLDRRLRADSQPSPLSKNGLVSTLGRDGEIAPGERFKLVCANQNTGSTVVGATEFHLFNEALGNYVFASRSHIFNANNCGRNCPIMNELEVCAVRAKSSDTKWRVYNGVFFAHKEAAPASDKWVYAADEPFPGEEGLGGEL